MPNPLNREGVSGILPLEYYPRPALTGMRIRTRKRDHPSLLWIRGETVRMEGLMTAA
jgi:hypothetical protein